MTCYFRQLREIFQKAGITVTTQNKKEIDRIIKGIVGTEGKNCPEVWREVKKRVITNETEFVEELKLGWINKESG